MSAELKQLVSVKRAKHGSFWSNRMEGSKLFKNLGGIDRKAVHFTKILKWWPRRVLQNLPKKPEEGYKGFGERMFRPCNMGQVLAQLRMDPETADKDHAFWIGHASQLLCLRSGTNIILDPLFSNRASPVSFIGPKRKYAPATSLDELPAIDVMLISHNHYDHLDKAGVKGIYQRNPGVRIVVPLKMSSLLKSWGIPAQSITEMDWQDEILVKDVVICCTPAQHWGKHSLFDNNEVLWCGWVIGWNRGGSGMGFTLKGSRVSPNEPEEVSREEQYSPAKEPDLVEKDDALVKPLRGSEHSPRNVLSSPDSDDSWVQQRSCDNLLPVDWSSLKTYYFPGDTAFNEVMFELIHLRIDHMDMAALPIGAYAPRWFMQSQHIDPENAAKAFKLLNCRRAYGVHYGTLELADEPLDEPPRILQEALSLEEIPPEEFVTIPMGEHVSF